MNKQLLIKRQQDLIDNPTARIAVCLCLDVSSSMSGAPIDELNEGVRLFYDAIKADPAARSAAEIGIVTFGDDHAECVADFAGVDVMPNAPRLEADGWTPMGEGVNLALDMLERRKNDYRRNGVDYYQPWLVIMTDGEPNGDENELERAISRTCNMVNGRKLTLFPIGIGGDADMEVLRRFSPKRTPLRLRGLNFREFFTWLSQSVAVVSQSTPGETGIKLDLEGVRGWGEL
ncbi:MAG: VWA domain-containing protein [Akkermansia muciniphila]|nr:VWA domain-containing protein [Akkermansia muciniphila]